MGSGSMYGLCPARGLFQFPPLLLISFTPTHVFNSDHDANNVTQVVMAPKKPKAVPTTQQFGPPASLTSVTGADVRVFEAADTPSIAPTPEFTPEPTPAPTASVPPVPPPAPKGLIPTAFFDYTKLNYNNSEPCECFPNTTFVDLWRST